MDNAYEAARVPDRSLAPALRDSAAVAVLVLLAWGSGALVASVGEPLAWVVTGGAAIAAGLLGRRRPLILILALLPASLLAATGLIPDAGRYQPTAVVAAPLALIWGARLVRGETQFASPQPLVAASLVAYVGWCAVTTLTSTARTSSAIYLGGLLVTLALIYAVAPEVLRDVRARRAVLTVVAGLGIVCGAIGIVLLAGPVVLFGRPVGQYEILELKWLGSPTGFILPRVIGPFFASNGQGIMCALALIAIVALRTTSTGRRRGMLTVAAMLVLVGLIDSISRNGWLLAILGLSVVAAPDVLGRRPSLAVASSAIMFVVFGLLVLNVYGADRRLDLMLTRYGSAGSSVNADLSAPPLATPSLLPSSPAPAPSPQGLAPSGAPGSSTVLVAVMTQPPSSENPTPGTSASATPVASSATVSPPVRLEIRGGSGLSGRIELWKASIVAIRQRPLLGWGLGQISVAIAPYVPDGFGGLTAHSTWFRTAVETGIPGLLAVLAWLIASAALIVRRLRFDPFSRTDPIRLAFVGSFLGLTAAATFDTFLLGGLTFMNIYWALSAVLAAAALAPADGLASARAPISPTLDRRDGAPHAMPSSLAAGPLPRPARQRWLPETLRERMPVRRP
jgi:hypothetical protein